MAPRGQHPRYDEPLLPLQQGTPLLSRSQSSPATSQPGLIPARLPSHPRDCAPFTATPSSSLPSWKCKTFAFPAAHPRSIARSARDAATAEAYTRAEPPKAASAGSAPPRMTKEEVAAVRDEMYERRRKAAKPRPDKSELERAAPLWLTVNRYSPARKGRAASSSEQGPGNAQSEPDPVTLIFAHANGFSKETWEPTLAHLIAKWDTSRLGEIEEIWSLDMINQGDAALLNRHTLGDTFDWVDNGRDILQFILSYLPESTRGVRSRSPASSKRRLKENLRTAGRADNSDPRAGIRPPGHMTEGSAARPGGASEDPSLSHWKREAGSASSAMGSESRSDRPSDLNRYERGVGGWVTEDSSLASTARPSNSTRPAKNSQSSSSEGGAADSRQAWFRPPVLYRQHLPSDMTDLLSLDHSQHSSASHRSPPPERTGKPLRWRNRRIVLVGHSVGAAGMCFASSAFPQLFETLILVDPTIFHEDTNRWTATGGLVEGAIVRRNMWDSRDSARSAFAKNKGFYGLWDPDVREGFVQFGLVPEALDSQGGAGAEGKVVLKVDRMQEAYVYADVETHGSKRAFYRLSYLPPSIDVHIIRADVGRSTIPEDSYGPFRTVVPHASHTRIKNAGHLIAQEKPQELAEEITGYLKHLATSKQSRSRGARARL